MLCKQDKLDTVELVRDAETFSSIDALDVEAWEITTLMLTIMSWLSYLNILYESYTSYNIIYEQTEPWFSLSWISVRIRGIIPTVYVRITLEILYFRQK